MKRACDTLLLMFSLASLSQADILTLIPSSGSVTGAPGSTVGWGYFIADPTSDWLVPTGLVLTNPSSGTVTDIFDFPVVAPNSAVSLAYSFVSPGGPGNSSGLIEYAVPLDVNSVQSGTIVLQYQLYDSDPDTNPNANPVGAPAASGIVGFEFTPTGTTAVPEPATWALLLSAIAVLAIRCRSSRW